MIQIEKISKGFSSKSVLSEVSFTAKKGRNNGINWAKMGLVNQL